MPTPAYRLCASIITGLLVLGGCDDDTPIAGIDALDGSDGLALVDDTARETTTIETVQPETDTVSPVDTSAPPDTIVADTTPPDTAAETAVVDDTTPADTAIADTAPDDTGAAETAPNDSDGGDLPPADEGELASPPYLMWVTETEVSVRWETWTPVVGRVDYGPDETLGQTVVEPEPVTSHELRLTGLSPDHLHSYRIVYGGGALPIRTFYTAPPADGDTPFSFIVWGDNQNGPSTFHSLVSLMAEHDPRFAVSVGDCVQNGTREEYRDQLFGPMNAFADQVPYLVAAGNHERYGDSNAALFNEYLSQPGDEHCFGWRYGGLFILFIDSELELDGPANQRECINQALRSEASTTATFRAAAFHKPPRIEWWFGGYLAFPDSMEAPWVREDLEPLLEAYDVDIVFNGHNHLYAHTPETDGGITWVTTGGGGGRIDDRGFLDVWRVGTWPQIETTIHEHHFLYVTLDGDSLLIEAIDGDGEVMHSFALFAD